jgi:tetratricopeptide (TPR) repeat protein
MLASGGNLALAMLGQRKFEEAEVLYRSHLPLRREILGDKDPGTLTAMHNLGTVLCGWGRYDEAEKILQEILALQTEVLGEDDAHTLSSLSALGVVLQSQRKVC